MITIAKNPYREKAINKTSRYFPATRRQFQSCTNHGENGANGVALSVRICLRRYSLASVAADYQWRTGVIFHTALTW